MRPKPLVLVLSLLAGAGCVWAQMADRPIVTRRRLAGDAVVSQARVNMTPLQSQSSVTLARLVSRMRISTTAIVHQSPVNPTVIVAQSDVNVAEIVSFSPWSDVTLVVRRHFDEPLVSMARVNVQVVADQFPTYDDYFFD